AYNTNDLLNVGPRPDGTLVPVQEAALTTIGQWMNTNGASIHGASSSRQSRRDGRSGSESHRNLQNQIGFGGAIFSQLLRRVKCSDTTASRKLSASTLECWAQGAVESAYSLANAAKEHGLAPDSDTGSPLAAGLLGDNARRRAAGTCHPMTHDSP
ncbi:alpha-L-fucosidase, partial [Streptomyces sp. BE303]|uniref:alpha-L-fucosidase n=1 Tax=Streptomyces sp. BE303 TaxID=3002528 RepID=UPI002E7A31F9